MSDSLSFPPGFLWGVATSSHQVEGGNFANQWWDFEQQGKLHTGDTARVALDWWRDAEGDLDLAQGLGLNTLRLSLEWSRLEPTAREWNGAAVARYRQLLEGLRRRGLRPLVTLHHFTNPLWFEARGSWLNPAAPGLFVRYVARVVNELGDLCDFWCTINEPNIYTLAGYFIGMFPPGRQGDLRGAFGVSGAMLRAHALAYREIHRLQPHATVGWSQNYNTFDPLHRLSPLDVAVTKARDWLLNDLVPRAILHGDVPLPLRLLTGDVSEAKGTYDYVGLNTYYRDHVRFDVTKPGDFFGTHEVPPGAPRSDQPPQGWAWGEVYPQGILRIAEELKGCGKPLYVTESGVADRHDRLRPWVLAKAAKAMHDAVARGIDLRGYFHWTLVDNFEWAEGFSTRFGLYALDLESRARTPRPSAGLYRQLAQQNALTRDMLEPFGPEVVAAAFGG